MDGKSQSRPSATEEAAGRPVAAAPRSKRPAPVLRDPGAGSLRWPSPFRPSDVYRMDLAINSIRDPEMRLQVADAFDRALRAKHSLRQTFLGSREPKFVGLVPLL